MKSIGHVARRLAHTRCFASSSSPSSLAAVVAAAKPDSLALLSPQQDIEWTFGELDDKARRLLKQLCGFTLEKMIAVDTVARIIQATDTLSRSRGWAVAQASQAWALLPLGVAPALGRPYSPGAAGT